MLSTNTSDGLVFMGLNGSIAIVVLVAWLLLWLFVVAAVIAVTIFTIIFCFKAYDKGSISGSTRTSVKLIAFGLLFSPLIYIGVCHFIGTVEYNNQKRVG